MPGIAGIISRHKSPEECHRLVAAMTQSMLHANFYVSGVKEFKSLGIYGGWVAQIGSFSANQVYENETGDIALLFSGECFVSPETRRDLIRKGHQVGERPGDWLVHQYEELDGSFFTTLNGLFSGLLIDKRQRRAFLFNDRYGMERIYFFETPDCAYFASEAKAILRVIPQTRAFDEEGVADFLTYGCTREWRTLFRGIQLLPGGSAWEFENGECTRRQYFAPSAWESLPLLSIAEFESQFRAKFSRVLPGYFESDMQIGISLTGGLDTRMIMACRPEVNHRPVCYTFAGMSGETSDVRLAAQVAHAEKLEHRILRIRPDFLSHFGSYVDRTVYITDGCCGASGAHEIHLHEQARQLSPIRVTGNFGSEVLRSMSTFKPIGLSSELFRPEFGLSMTRSGGTHAVSREHPVTFAAFREIPWSLFGSLAVGRSQVIFRTPYLDNEIVALAFQAPKALRQSPASALRFIQHVSPALNEIPTDRGLSGNGEGLAVFLRHVYSEFTFKLEYLYNDGPPEWMSRMDPLIKRLGAITVAGHHKYLPYRHWYQHELASYLHEAMAQAAARQSPFWNSKFLRKVAPAHVRGHRNYLREINAVLTLDAVQRTLLQEPAASSGNKL